MAFPQNAQYKKNFQKDVGGDDDGDGDGDGEHAEVLRKPIGRLRLPLPLKSTVPTDTRN